nr:hypothetical protein [Tanacetum cinerariifolium]
MDTTIDQQVAMDKALVPHAQRLRIGRSNFCLLSDIKSKESTLQLATATVHHHAILFRMDNKKHIMNLESFRDMLHICPRVNGQSFAEPPFEEEILAFIHFLRHFHEGYHPSFHVKGFVHSKEEQELTNEEIKNFNAYKEYYAITIGAAPPKPKASVQRTRSSFDTSITPPTTATGVPDVPTDESEEEISWNSTDEEGDDDEGKDS